MNTTGSPHRYQVGRLIINRWPQLPPLFGVELLRHNGRITLALDLGKVSVAVRLLSK